MTLYQNSCFSARENWRLRWQARFINENYLGMNDFEVEINRLCGEFYDELKKVLGFCPVQWYSIKQMKF